MTITPGQTLENPVTGERFTFTHAAARTRGELLAFDLGLAVGGGGDDARKYDHEAHAPLLTVGVQRLLLAPLVFSARRLRVNPAPVLA